MIFINYLSESFLIIDFAKFSLISLWRGIGCDYFVFKFVTNRVSRHNELKRADFFKLLYQITSFYSAIAISSTFLM